VGIGAERSREDGEAAPVPGGQVKGGWRWCGLVVFEGRGCGDDDEVVAFGELAESVDAGRADLYGV